MQLRKALTAERPWRLSGRFFVIALALSTMGATCGGIPLPGVVPPTITLSVNGVPDDMKGLLVLPPTGFVVNVAWQPGSYPIDPTHFYFEASRWGTPDASYVFDIPLKSDGTGAIGVFPGQLEPGTYTLSATVGDTQYNFSYSELAVAVRNFGGAPPIGAGQQIWLDFESDRDATPGADFPVDLQAFGLGSTAAPLVSSWVLDAVTARVLARVDEVYHDQATNGLPGPDPVAVGFSSTDPGAGDVTRVCIGGEDPGGGMTIGAILTDPKNSNRNSIECATLPPTGIFPRELLILAGEAAFQTVFNPLIAANGGVPVGEHPLDATVLAPGFDPGTATPAELARYDLVQTAIQGFADMLGSIVAHECGHALGLVPVGAPGGGLYGGTSGAELNHDVTPTGVSPTENYLMNSGYTFSFARLAGLNGNALPYFRPLDYAYLRDRVVIDSAVTLLAFPPVVTSVAPSMITADGYTQITITGTGFLPVPAVRCVNPGFHYYAVGEALRVIDQRDGLGPSRPDPARRLRRRAAQPRWPDQRAAGGAHDRGPVVKVLRSPSALLAPSLACGSLRASLAPAHRSQKKSLFVSSGPASARAVGRRVSGTSEPPRSRRSTCSSRSRVSFSQYSAVPKCGNAEGKAGSRQRFAIHAA